MLLYLSLCICICFLVCNYIRLFIYSFFMCIQHMPISPIAQQSRPNYAKRPQSITGHLATHCHRLKYATNTAKRNKDTRCNSLTIWKHDPTRHQTMADHIKTYYHQQNNTSLEKSIKFNENFNTRKPSNIKKTCDKIHSATLYNWK